MRTFEIFSIYRGGCYLVGNHVKYATSLLLLQVLCVLLNFLYGILR